MGGGGTRKPTKVEKFVDDFCDGLGSDTEFQSLLRRCLNDEIPMEDVLKFVRRRIGEAQDEVNALKKEEQKR